MMDSKRQQQESQLAIKFKSSGKIPTQDNDSNNSFPLQVQRIEHRLMELRNTNQINADYCYHHLILLQPNEISFAFGFVGNNVKSTS
jgi:hypothetical protein